MNTVGNAAEDGVGNSTDARVESRKPRRWDAAALIPLLAGALCLSKFSGVWFLFMAVPGGLLLSSSVSLLLWPGDVRILRFMAIGGLLGTVLALPSLFVAGFWPALAIAALSLVSYLIAGRRSLDEAPRLEGAPRAERSASNYAKAALDESLMAYLAASSVGPSANAVQETGIALERLAVYAQGPGDDPEADPLGLFPAPPAPQQFSLGDFGTRNQPAQLLRFDSGYEPPAVLPGAVAWSARARNRECQAVVMRHAGASRHWVLGIHGYRMGNPRLSMRVFAPEWLHRQLGFNLLLPVLPLHGPRSAGSRSGDGFFDGDPVDLVHALSQALWDLRRSIAWIRAQDPEARIGVLGFSLGGYCTALLAGHEPGLDWAAAGVPVVDLAPVLWSNFLVPYRDDFEAAGLNLDSYRKLLRVVSPLARPARLESSRLGIFAGTADRVVPQRNPMLLSAHWKVPVGWYQGGHITFRGQAVVKDTISAAMRGAGWIDAEGAAVKPV